MGFIATTLAVALGVGVALSVRGYLRWRIRQGVVQDQLRERYDAYIALICQFGLEAQKVAQLTGRGGFSAADIEKVSQDLKDRVKDSLGGIPAGESFRDEEVFLREYRSLQKRLDDLKVS